MSVRWRSFTLQALWSWLIKAKNSRTKIHSRWDRQLRQIYEVHAGTCENDAILSTATL